VKLADTPPRLGGEDLGNILTEKKLLREGSNPSPTANLIQ